ncbi:MAG: hypothetical protein WCC17_14685 [Candidatus Nitrosopolaris sp.]
MKFTPNVCSNCLTKITPNDEEDVLNLKPVSQSDLPSEHSSPQSENPNPSESATTSEQSSPSKNPSSSESSPPLESEGGGGAGERIVLWKARKKWEHSLSVKL